VALSTLVDRESMWPPTTMSREGSVPGIQASSFRCVRVEPQKLAENTSSDVASPVAWKAARTYAAAAPIPWVALAVVEQELRVLKPTRRDRSVFMRAASTASTMPPISGSRVVASTACAATMSRPRPWTAAHDAINETGIPTRANAFFQRICDLSSIPSRVETMAARTYWRSEAINNALFWAIR